MKKICLIAIVFFYTPVVYAQKNAAAKYAAVINTPGLKKHLQIIAADDMEGRETGKEGQRKAAAYIESQFTAIGLKKAAKLNSYQQLYPLYRDSLLSSTITFSGETMVYGNDFITPLSLNETNSFNAGTIVFAGYGIQDSAYSDYTSLDVKGKVVVFFSGEPKRDGKFFINPEGRSSAWTFPGLSKKLEVAAAKGAVGALVINTTQESFTPAVTENSKRTNLYYPRKDNAPEKNNYALLSHAMANKILTTHFDSLFNLAKNASFFTMALPEIKAPLSYDFKKYRNVVNASNVLGIVEGSDKKDEYVFLTAHYDHLGIRDGKIYNGADDDGSGTVAIIKMAEAFAKAKKAGKGPRRTVVFITFSGEEKGLLGSEFYSDNPVFPLEKTSVDLNIDMIGRVDTERKTADTLNYIYVVGHDKISSELPLINEGANNKYTQLSFDYKFDDPNDPNRIYFRSDHYNFARKGVPVLFFYDGMLKSDYHKPTDDIELINWPLFEKRAKMVFYTAWEMANRNEMLKRDKPIPTATR